MNDFVAKPIDFKNICAKIRKWLPEDKIRLAEDKFLLEDKLLLTEELREPEKAEADGALPEIAGLDVREGVKNSGSLELFTKLLGDYYRMIDIKASKIEQCLREGLIRDYTVEVHALKSASRTIGAMELSRFFARMEQRGNAEDHDALAEETPKLLEMYRSYKKILEPFGRMDEREKQPAAREELIQILRSLIGAVDSFELDRIDEAYSRLEKRRIPEEISGLMDELRAYVADVSMEEIVDTCHRMIGQLSRPERVGEVED